MEKQSATNSKLFAFGKALLLVGTLLTFVFGAILLGVYEYAPTLMITSGLIILLIGLIILFVGLLIVNARDERSLKAAGWVYMSFGLSLLLLTVARLTFILQEVSAVGFDRFLDPGFLLQILPIVISFILNLVGVYLIFLGISKIVQENGNAEAAGKIRSCWRMLRISGVFFLLMKLLSVFAEPLWQEAAFKADSFMGSEAPLALGLGVEPFEVGFFINLSTIANVLTVIAAIWMALSFIRIYISTVRAWRS